MSDRDPEAADHTKYRMQAILLDVQTSNDYAGSVTRSPGTVRDAIIDYLSRVEAPVSTSLIVQAVERRLGPVSQSSIRSYLALNTPEVFTRIDRGVYKLTSNNTEDRSSDSATAPNNVGLAELYLSDAFEWIALQSSNSIEAVVTDPPYGVIEFSPKEQAKLRGGRGGVWRIPPSFDGHLRAPLPRFTTLSNKDLGQVYSFMLRLARGLYRILVPGANLVIASNPLVVHLVVAAVADAGFEPRGYITRLVMTLRGGDRPKNAHEEFSGVSVLPRSMAEPWVMARKPLEGRVQDNLRRWGTGGWRRPSELRPFGDVIPSSPTPSRERRLAPHPSLKPQAFMRALVRASLPLGEGRVFDPFAGAGSTLAAANAVGYYSVGTEVDQQYHQMALEAIGPLGRLVIKVDPA